MRFVRQDEGFSLLELLISLVILLTVSGSAFEVLSYYQKAYLSTEMRADVHSGIRAALALMTQEITQAGLLSFPAKTTQAAIAKDVNLQSVALNPGAGDIFDGEKLLIETGSSQEVVSVTSHTSSSVTGIFTKDHATGAIVTAPGVFPEGILPSSSATQLRLVGDLNGDGNLVYGYYDCNTATGNLSRYMNKVSAPGVNPSQLLMDHVVSNPGGTPCFQYTNTTVRGFTFVTGVAITISVQTSTSDPQTGAFVTVTESLLNISPRNVLAGLENARTNLLTRLQPTPAIAWP